MALLVIFVFVEPATAQQRIRITEGQVAPTPIAIAEFTNLGGEISDAGGRSPKSSPMICLVRVCLTRLTVPLSHR